MRITSECIECLLARHLKTARLHGDDIQVTAFARDLMKMLLDGPEDMAAPYYSPRIAQLFHDHFGLPMDRYKEEKDQSNAFALEHMDEVRQIVAEAEDPLYAGLQCAILGNYLDFSALQGEVSFDRLHEMLKLSRTFEVDRESFEQLRRELSGAKTLLYLTDNAGEIGFDRVFAEEIHRQFPELEITFCVRGGDALNDATRADAAAVGIPFPVIDNGNNIAGTVLSCISGECRDALYSADVIIAKGQANVETLLGCGLNIYYAFLVKCSKFITEFGKPKLTPLLHRERN